MAFLHPDKIVGVTRAIQDSPLRKKAQSTEQMAASAAAQGPALTPQAQQEPPGLMANLAYQFNHRRAMRHLGQIAARQAIAPAQPATPKAATGEPTITIKLPAPAQVQ